MVNQIYDLDTLVSLILDVLGYAIELVTSNPLLFGVFICGVIAVIILNILKKAVVG